VSKEATPPAALLPGEWRMQGSSSPAPGAIRRKVAEAEDGSEIWGDGKQTRSFLYIDECVEAVRRLVDSDFTGPVNIGSDEIAPRRPPDLHRTITAPARTTGAALMSFSRAGGRHEPRQKPIKLHTLIHNPSSILLEAVLCYHAIRRSRGQSLREDGGGLPDCDCSMNGQAGRRDDGGGR